MKVVKFEDLIAWQKSQDFAILIYQNFSGLKDYGFKDQICRAAIPISNNIAEGFDRNSNADFTRFLYISISSCSEVKSMLYLSQRLKYSEPAIAQNLIEHANEVSKIIRGIIKSLNYN